MQNGLIAHLRGQNKMKKLLSGLFLFLISGAAFADSAWNTTGLPTPVASHTDLSVAYLAQVFGTVGNSLQGTSGQMLGMLFSKLNEGIMVVAGFWLIYTVITIILRSAMDGSFMGQNKNVFWVVIRIAIAFAMLIPGPMTGYNIIQDIVMKVVVEGVSLADQTWNYGLGYIGTGGTLWRTPETTGGGTAVVSQGQAKQILTPAQSIFNAEVCMVASSMQNANDAQGSSGSGVVNGPAPTLYSVVEKSASNGSGSFQFPGLGNSKNYSTNIQNGSESGNCGGVTWGPESSGITGSDANGQSSELMAKAALSQMVYDLYPAAQKYACQNYTGGGNVCSGVDTDSSDVSSDNINATFNSLVNYVNGVYPLAQAANEGAAKTMMDFIPNAMKEGWMIAGRYYWDLSQIQAYMGKVSNIGSYSPPKASGYSAATSQSSSLKTFMATSSLKNAWSSYKSGALTQLTNYSQASGAGDTGQQYPEVEKDSGNKILDLFLGPTIGDIVSLFALFSAKAGAMGMGPDPILFLHEVGMKSMAVAGDIWIGLAIVLFGASAATIVCQSTLNLDTPLQAISDWIKPPLMILAAALLGIGVLLGYYVPLYPFMLFTFGVIGWIISVIEAMVAAPLIAFGLTHPEGHDFLGEAKQGLILLLGVFLRPVLMVIGLIAGMILSYVSLRILVYTYSGFLSDIFYQAVPYNSGTGSPGDVVAGAAIATGNVAAGSGGISGLVMSLFTFPLMLAIFAALVYVVTNQCFSLIYRLPDYVLRWIGGPTEQSMSAQMAGQMQGAISQMGSQMGSGGNAGHKGIQKGKAQRDAAGGDKGNDTSHSGGNSPKGDGKPPSGGGKPPGGTSGAITAT